MPFNLFDCFHEVLVGKFNIFRKKSIGTVNQEVIG